MNNIRLKFFAVFCFAILQIFGSFLFANLPERPNPPRLLNDFASVFSPQEANILEAKLRKFNDTTSNQIVIVTLQDMGNTDAASLAYEIGEKWGVGQAQYDNGVVILYKPKNQSKGEIFIAPGYGLEGVLPDAICKRIIEEKMIPHFREEEIFAGMQAGLDMIMPIASGEYSYEELNKNPLGVIGIGILLFCVLFTFVFIAITANKSKYNNGGGQGGVSSGIDPATAILLGSLLGRSSGRSSGGFGGGGFGGFGGFGGGGFGGGGAGGSW